MLRGRHVLNCLGGPGGVVHQRLLALEAARVVSVDPPPSRADRHIVDQWQHQLESQGLLPDRCTRRMATRASIAADPALIERGGAIIGSVGQCVVLHPGAGSRAKQWPARGFLELADRLRAAGRSVAIVTGPVERERGGDWSSSSARELRLDDPTELVCVLAAAHAFVGNDSGPAHLAALLGVRTRVVFGSTDPRVWRTLGDDVRAFRGDPAQPDDWGVAVEEVARSVQG
jgi:ADP-heptose:LPS heptosyltransferase